MQIAIIDDEPHIINRLREIIETNLPQHKIVGTADTIISGFDLISKGNPDLVLLDINLSDGSGFDLIQKLQPIAFKLIFITAFEQFAIKAFKFSAIDYILKPFDDTEIIETIIRADSNVNKNSLASEIEAFMANMKVNRKEDKKIVFKTNESIQISNVSDIIRLESDGAYTIVYLKNGKKLLISKNLKEYEDMLIEYNFFRVHHSHLININCLDSYQKGDGGFVVMSDKSNCPVSKRRKDALMELLNRL